VFGTNSEANSLSVEERMGLPARVVRIPSGPGIAEQGLGCALEHRMQLAGQPIEVKSNPAFVGLRLYLKRLTLALKSKKKIILLNQDEITIRFFKNIGSYNVLVSKDVPETIQHIKEYMAMNKVV